MVFWLTVTVTPPTVGVAAAAFNAGSTVAAGKAASGVFVMTTTMGCARAVAVNPCS